MRGLVFEATTSLAALAGLVGSACRRLTAANVPHNLFIVDRGARVFLLPNAFAERKVRPLPAAGSALRSSFSSSQGMPSTLAGTCIFVAPCRRAQRTGPVQLAEEPSAVRSLHACACLSLQAGPALEQCAALGSSSGSRSSPKT